MCRSYGIIFPFRQKREKDEGRGRMHTVRKGTMFSLIETGKKERDPHPHDLHHTRTHTHTHATQPLIMDCDNKKLNMLMQRGQENGWKQHLTVDRHRR